MPSTTNELEQMLHCTEDLGTNPAAAPPPATKAPPSTTKAPPPTTAASAPTTEASPPTTEARPPAAACTALVGTLVDEQTPIVMLARMQPPGSTLYLEAGAGAGKTTVAERLIHASKTNSHGAKMQLLATTMTKAGVNEMKSRPGIPNSIVKSLHGLGFEALCTTYKQRLVASLKSHGIVAEAQQIKDIRSPIAHRNKYKLMAQTMMPPTAFDKELCMHVPDRVSAACKLLVDFVEQLTTKAFEAGFGQPGNPGMDSLEALQLLAKRYELEPLIERAYSEMSFELRPIADRSAAILQCFGGGALSEPVAHIEGMVSSMLPAHLQGDALHTADAMRFIADKVTLDDRLHAGVIVTAAMLNEAVKVAMRPSWRGLNTVTNVLDPQDVMHLPAVSFCEMVALPANAAVLAPVLARNGCKYDAIVVDEGQDSNKAQAGLIHWATGDHTQLIVIGDPKQRCFSFASASAAALAALIAPRTLGVVDRRVLTNNFRSARLICKEIEGVLDEMGCDRGVRPVRPDHGEVILNASLRRGELQAWLAEGTVAILSRLNAVLACFKAHFLKVGQPFVVLGQQGVLPPLLRLLDTFDDNATLPGIVLQLRGLVSSESSSKLSLEDQDLALCLAIFANSLLSELYSGAASAKRRLAQLLNKAYKGSSNSSNNAAVRGMPILANGHGAKGHEFHTVIIAEPELMCIQKIIDNGGEEAEDEIHLKYVLVSRAKDRLAYLENKFKLHGAAGIVELCTPI